MRKHTSLLLGFVIAATTSSSLASEGETVVAESFWKTSARSDFHLALNHYLEKRSDDSGQAAGKQSQPGKKSVAKAVLLSAALPGSGQIYNGSKLKAVAFLAIEVAAIATHFHFQNRGSDLETLFEQNADHLWDEDSYWSWMSTISGIDESNFSTAIQFLSALRDYERENFSHFLPERKNQQYYENIGKYDQFVIGWHDFRVNTLSDSDSLLTLDVYRSGFYQGADLTTISGQRNDYVVLRREANDNFKKATNMATLAIFNHVVSAFDAGLTAKSKNKVLVETNLGMRGQMWDNQVVPALTLDVKW